MAKNKASKEVENTKPAEASQPEIPQSEGYDPGHQDPSVVDTQAGETFDKPSEGLQPDEEIVHTPTGEVVSIEEAAADLGVTLTDSEGDEIKGPELRKIDLIVLHCSDSDIPKHDNIKTIREWHTERGFTGPDGIEGTEDDIGYHYVITQDGKIHEGRPIEKAGAHVKGHNEHSIGICLTGKKLFSKDQYKSANKLAKALMKDLGLSWRNVRLHSQLDKSKTCPNFRMEEVVSA